MAGFVPYSEIIGIFRKIEKFYGYFIKCQTWRLWTNFECLGLIFQLMKRFGDKRFLRVVDMVWSFKISYCDISALGYAYALKIGSNRKWWRILETNRNWWRILETKYIGDKFEMLVTVLAVFVSNILYERGSISDRLSVNISLGFPLGHQYPKDVTNIEIPSLTPKNCDQHKVTNINLSPTSMWPHQNSLLNHKSTVMVTLQIMMWKMMER